METEAEFWSNIDVCDPQSCWVWKRSKLNNGHGRACWNGKQVLAHRLAWALSRGPIPDGLHCCHICDNPPCCNPAHLFLGTHQDNMQDMIKKGRNRNPKGSLVVTSRLEEDQVIAVMARLLTGGETQRQLARLFGVGDSTISDIWCGRQWSHLFKEG